MIKNKRKTIKNYLSLTVLLIFAVSLLFVPQLKTSAAINKQVNYQGQLLDSSGDPVADSSYSITFKLYTVASGGSPVWSQTKSVSTTDGVFSTLLDVTSLNFSQAYYLGVKVGADAEMTPRKVVASVPQAYNANNLIGDGLISITGGALLGADEYINFGSTSGTLGYGIRDNGGTVELKNSGGAWVPVGSGTGDVVGPGSATDNAIARFDLATGKLIQNSGVTIDDTGNLNIATSAAYQQGGVDILTTSPTLFNTFVGEGAGDSNTTGTGNNIIGYRAGYFNQTGSGNTILGDRAGYGVTGNSSSYNTFIGGESGYFNTTGHDNTFIGYDSGYSNTEGFYNTFLGIAGVSNTTGSENIMIGYAGASNTTGSQNVYIGENAGSSNITGDNNVAIGTDAGVNATVSNLTFIGHQAGQANTTGTGGSFLGYQAGYSNTTGTSNTFLGYQSGRANINDSNNTFIGYLAGYSNSGGDGTFIGAYAGRSNTTGNNNIAIGRMAGLSNTTGGNNVYVGERAGYFNQTGLNNIILGTTAGYGSSGNSYSSSTIVGIESGYYNTASFVTFLGYRSGWSNTTGAQSVFLGRETGFSNTTGDNNVFVGSQAGASNTTASNLTFVGNEAGEGNTTGAGNNFMGYRAGYFNQTGNYNTLIGHEAGYGVTGNSYSGNTFVGYQSGHANTLGGYNTALGYQTLYSNAGGTSNIAVGYWSLYNNTSGGDNIAIGETALYTNTTGTKNVAIGVLALAFSNGNYNTAIGDSALSANTAGIHNSAVGLNALMDNTTGDYNSAIGSNSLAYNTTGDNNTAVGVLAAFGSSGASNISNNVIIGHSAGIGVLTGADNNILIGYQAADNLTTGANNLILGYDIDAPSATGSNQLSIGNLIFGTGIDGTATTVSSGNIGIGINSPSARFHTYTSNAAVTTTNYNSYIENLATNVTTDSIDKYGLYITSTGSFTGSGGGATNNYGLYINTTSGGDNNYDIYAGSGAYLSTAGTWTNAPSYRRYKENFTDTGSYLDKLMALDIYEWQYRDEKIDGLNRYQADSDRHASPFLDEFYQTFQVGTENGFNLQDLSGVALASVKELNTRFLDQTQGLNLKTNKNITNIIDLQISIDNNLGIIEKTLTAQEEKTDELGSQIATLTSQLAQLQQNTAQDIKLAQIDLNTQDIDYIRLLLGTDRVGNPEDINILGDIEAEGIVAGAYSVKTNDEESKTIGQATITPVVIDEDQNGIDDNTGSDGRSVMVKSDSVTNGSEIFITPKIPIDQSLAVTEIVAEESFKVELKNPIEEEVNFGWWIVSKE